MITNKELMKYCLEHLSSIRDESYDVDKELIIIPRTRTEDNEFSANCKKLINLFTTIATLNYENDFSKDDELVEKINNIFLKVKYMNFFPFNQYLQIHNLTYGIYCNLNFNEQKQIIKEYINDRHAMYLEHGYTNTIYQTLCDSYAHKRKGDTGTKKLRLQAENHEIKHYDFGEENYYLNPDKGDEKLFFKIINKEKIRYTYYLQKNAKLPDLFLKINGKFILVEHKIIKEGGGHQNNVIVEIKDFINESDKNVYYVSYIDGKFFETTFNLDYKEDGTLKKDVTNKNINEIFESNERSYIVNTSGFDKLLDELLNI